MISRVEATELTLKRQRELQEEQFDAVESKYAMVFDYIDQTIKAAAADGRNEIDFRRGDISDAYELFNMADIVEVLIVRYGYDVSLWDPEFWWSCTVSISW